MGSATSLLLASTFVVVPAPTDEDTWAPGLASAMLGSTRIEIKAVEKRILGRFSVQR